MLFRSGDVDVFNGMTAGGIAIVNTEKPDFDTQVPEGVKVYAVDATTIALEELGVPITNTTLMGAFAAATGEIKFDALEHALRRRFSGSMADKNVKAAERAYNLAGGAA